MIRPWCFLNSCGHLYHDWFWNVIDYRRMEQGQGRHFPCLIAGLTMGFTAMLVAHIGKGIVLTGVIAGMATVLVMIVYLKLQGKPLLDRSCVTEQEKEIERGMSLKKALAPWLILIGACLVINFWPPLFNLLFKDLAMPLNIIPGGKPVNTRMLWNAYTWVIVSTLLAVPFIKPSKAQWKDIMKKCGNEPLVLRSQRPYFLPLPMS
jgi:lactate permease